MGGLGSGRPGGSRRNTVESCRSLDVNRLQRTGCLEPGRAGSWQWTRDGERVAWINLRAEADRLHLWYRVRLAGEEWRARSGRMCARPSALSACPAALGAVGPT